MGKGLDSAQANVLTNISVAFHAGNAWHAGTTSCEADVKQQTPSFAGGHLHLCMKRRRDGESGISPDRKTGLEGGSRALPHEFCKIT